jgi:adenylate kinase
MKLVVLLGAPGSGKGTIAGRLVTSDRAFRHVSSGDLLRDAVKRQTPAGREADGFMKRGLLVPDVLIARLMAELVAEVNESCTLLLDGFPRTVEQARMLDEMAAGGGAQFQAVVLLEVGDEVLVERIAGRRHCPTCDRGYHVTKIPPKLAGVCDGCGTTLAVRKDDNPETVKNRLDVYREQTMPLIDFYRDRGLLRRVDGLGPIDGIVERVRQAIA